MDSDHVLVLFLALALVGVAVALAYASPLGFGGEGDGVTDASLAGFETTEPYCGDPDTISTSSRTHDISGGEALVINQTVPISSNDTMVNASLEKFGPQRFILDVARETPENASDEGPATPTPDPERANQGTPIGNENGESGDTGTAEEPCHPEVRYNATIHLVEPREYTVLVTYDGELVNAIWHDGDDSGSYERIPGTPREPSDDNETTTNGEVRPQGFERAVG